MRRRFAVALAVAAGALGPAAGSAQAAEWQAFANTFLAFTTPELVVFEGDTLRFTNLDRLPGTTSTP